MSQGLHDRLRLSFRQIEILHVVMTTRSITAAARHLNISQPSLSRTIRRLEDTLELPLFERNKRGLTPTSEALLIFSQIDPIVRQIAGLGDQISRIIRGGEMVFRLGATASVARFHVPQVLRSLSLKNPAIEFFFDVLSIDQIQDYLLTGRGECVVTIVSVDHPSIGSTSVGQGHLVAVVPTAHPLAEREVLTVSDFAGADLISFQEGGPHYRAVKTFLQSASTPPHVRAIVRFSETGIALADQGLGIALVDNFTVMGPLGTNVVVRPVRDAPTFKVFVHWNRERARSQHVRAVIQGLRQKLS